ncbi:MAG: GNAT family N-acetyltransferase [Gemmatimonadales bacterium]
MAESAGTIEHTEDGHRGAFLYKVDGRQLGEMTYSRVNDSLVIIDHTEVDPTLSGQGIGRRLLDAAVAWGREQGTKFMATCPYALAQFKRDPSIRDVVA